MEEDILQVTINSLRINNKTNHNRMSINFKIIKTIYLKINHRQTIWILLKQRSILILRIACSHTLDMVWVQIQAQRSIQLLQVVIDLALHQSNQIITVFNNLIHTVMLEQLTQELLQIIHLIWVIAAFQLHVNIMVITTINKDLEAQR